jgi:hypothetical protein
MTNSRTIRCSFQVQQGEPLTILAAGLFPFPSSLPSSSAAVARSLVRASQRGYGMRGKQQRPSRVALKHGAGPAKPSCEPTTCRNVTLRAAPSGSHARAPRSTALPALGLSGGLSIPTQSCCSWRLRKCSTWRSASRPRRSTADVTPRASPTLRERGRGEPYPLPGQWRPTGQRQRGESHDGHASRKRST